MFSIFTLPITFGDRALARRKGFMLSTRFNSGNGFATMRGWEVTGELLHCRKRPAAGPVSAGAIGGARAAQGIAGLGGRDGPVAARRSGCGIAAGAWAGRWQRAGDGRIPAATAATRAIRAALWGAGCVCAGRVPPGWLPAGSAADR